jgi:hypothetical protein
MDSGIADLTEIGPPLGGVREGRVAKVEVVDYELDHVPRQAVGLCGRSFGLAGERRVRCVGAIPEGISLRLGFCYTDHGTGLRFGSGERSVCLLAGMAGRFILAAYIISIP